MKLILTLLLFLLSCTSDKATTSSITPVQPEPKVTTADLTKAKTTQVTSTEVIKKEATSIKDKTKEPDTKKSAEVILVENDKLIGNTEVIIKVIEDKSISEAYEKKLRAVILERDTTVKALTDENNKLKEDKNWIYGLMTVIFYGVGCVAMAAGLFVFIRSGFNVEGLWIFLFGVVLIVVDKFAKVLDKYAIYVMIAIFIALTYFIYKAYKHQCDVSKEAVKATEITKEELKKVSPEAVEKLFGDYATPGLIHQSEDVISTVAKIRKDLNERWKPTMKKDK